MKGLHRIARMAAMFVVLASASACGGDDRTASNPPEAMTETPGATQMAAATETAPATEAAEPADQAAGDDASFPPAQLDAMVAPIALYPDALLMQVLMASTYPTEIVMADRWRRDHADLEGDALNKALEDQSWDPSVSSLTFFPDVLSRMSQNLEWTTDLGNAFLAQQDDVMNACQRMRLAAEKAGTLESNKEQTVTVQNDVVTIAPANPEVVYVPQYNTTNVYGSSYQPPPQYYPAVQTGYSGATLATTGLLAFGAGMLTSYALWGGCDWDDHHVYYGGYHGGGGYKGPSYKGPTYKVNGDVNVNVGGNRQQWQHRPEHRRGVSYKNPRTRDQYARYDPKRGNFDEKKMRGHDRDANLGHRQRPGSHPAQTRPATPPKMPARPTAKPAAKTPSKAAKPQTRPAARQPERSPATGKSAFSGSRNAGVQRQASQRGAQSRGRSAGHTMARSGGGGGRGGGGGKHRGGGRKGR